MRARTALPASVAAVLLALTGCGSSGSGTADDAGTVSPSASSSPAGQPADPEGSGTETGGSEVPEVLDFTATTVDGRPFDATTLAGKPTVLWFWAPWCPKCKAQAAETAEVAADHRDEVNVVGVAGLDSNTAMKGFVTDTGTGSFPHLSDEKGEVWKRFGVTEQSRYVLLDETGETVYEGVLPGGEGLAGKVAGLTG
ncbi:redoxin domain-containing protein [Streptomyces sp. RKND-216]|uniref:redoxin domain-containing protein n=1 Tax=Streptomyces sp. RKND-216 TaxID=2562581 RepID=UPI00109E2358|nr:redoxin domain-containing protein [Streptomyces sp. RKND-216]THA23585.1 redoxin domain-containing protein [Streptomyces sp. RKND-216]